METKWISVKDRLPEDGVEVLITDGENIDVSFCELTYFGDDPNEMEWFGRISPWHFGNITHWMPLPELPKGVK